MTREEKEQTGKYVLKMARLLEDGCYQQEMLLKAAHIIYEALEQEPTTKNDLGVDCICRDSAIKALDYDIKYFEFKSGVSKHMDDIAKLLNTIYENQVNNIKALPSVTQIRPKGHWCPQNDDYFDWYECSECGYGSEGEMQYSSEVDVRTNYCPNCGADMREVEE